ncbi:hypothetical protein HUK76_24200 [Citrobacter portucalensis]|uniref:hypothetical protein n=1 Tax=Citrobacter portucalensis TaxID=1639133 RepID=UPI00157FC0F1|nr:hypothetical protein [Citrobacter portucalensis]NUH56750.1 hypothetical protein [Citrobacter portucalensis]HAV7881606.1 hypothetical protein [Escherichia coli]HAV9548541.1 hypothetical protein [Escherichia coli]
MNRHTLTRISEEAFNELNRIKQTTNLPHKTIMQLAIAKEITEADLLKTPVSRGRKHIRIEREALNTLKSENKLPVDIARLLSLKIYKLSQEV